MSFLVRLDPLSSDSTVRKEKWFAFETHRVLPLSSLWNCTPKKFPGKYNYTEGVVWGQNVYVSLKVSILCDE